MLVLACAYEHVFDSQSSRTSRGLRSLRLKSNQILLLST